jgi:hypothetical protein
LPLLLLTFWNWYMLFLTCFTKNIYMGECFVNGAWSIWVSHRALLVEFKPLFCEMEYPVLNHSDVFHDLWPASSLGEYLNYFWLTTLFPLIFSCNRLPFLWRVMLNDINCENENPLCVFSPHFKYVFHVWDLLYLHTKLVLLNQNICFA